MISISTYAGTAPVVQVVPNVNETATFTDQALQFDCSVTDPDSTTHTFKWNFGDGSSSSSSGNCAASHEYTAPGTYTAEVTATDPTNFSDSDTVSVTVATVGVGADIDTCPGSMVTLQGVLSDANTTGRYNVSWEPEPGATPLTGLEAEYRYTRPGTYSATLSVTVSDSYGTRMTEHSLDVMVQPSEAFLSATPAAIQVGESVEMTGGVQGCTEALENVTEGVLDNGNSSQQSVTLVSSGSSAAGVTTLDMNPVTATFSQSGDFIPELSVTDAFGNRTTATTQVSVSVLVPEGDPCTTYTIESVSNGNWFDAATWSTGQVPGKNDTVKIEHQVYADNPDTTAANVIVASNALCVTESGVLEGTVEKGLVVRAGVGTTVPSATTGVIHNFGKIWGRSGKNAGGELSSSTYTDEICDRNAPGYKPASCQLARCDRNSPLYSAALCNSGNVCDSDSLAYTPRLCASACRPDASGRLRNPWRCPVYSNYRICSRWSSKYNPSLCIVAVCSQDSPWGLSWFPWCKQRALLNRYAPAYNPHYAGLTASSRSPATAGQMLRIYANKALLNEFSGIILGGKGGDDDLYSTGIYRQTYNAIAENGGGIEISVPGEVINAGQIGPKRIKRWSGRSSPSPVYYEDQFSDYPVGGNGGAANTGRNYGDAQGGNGASTTLIADIITNTGRICSGNGGPATVYRPDAGEPSPGVCRQTGVNPGSVDSPDCGGILTILPSEIFINEGLICSGANAPATYIDPEVIMQGSNARVIGGRKLVIYGPENTTLQFAGLQSGAITADEQIEIILGSGSSVDFRGVTAQVLKAPQVSLAVDDILLDGGQTLADVIESAQPVTQSPGRIMRRVELSAQPPVSMALLETITMEVMLVNGAPMSDMFAIDLTEVMPASAGWTVTPVNVPGTVALEAMSSTTLSFSIQSPNTWGASNKIVLKAVSLNDSAISAETEVVVSTPPQPPEGVHEVVGQLSGQYNTDAVQVRIGDTTVPVNPDGKFAFYLPEGGYTVEVLGASGNPVSTSNFQVAEEGSLLNNEGRPLRKLTAPVPASSGSGSQANTPVVVTVPTVPEECTQITEFSDERRLRVPRVRTLGDVYQVDLDLIPTDDGSLRFKLMDAVPSGSLLSCGFEDLLSGASFDVATEEVRLPKVKFPNGLSYPMKLKLIPQEESGEAIFEAEVSCTKPEISPEEIHLPIIRFPDAVSTTYWATLKKVDDMDAGTRFETVAYGENLFASPQCQEDVKIHMNAGGPSQLELPEMEATGPSWRKLELIPNPDSDKLLFISVQ
jgi:hypothetical protein